MCITLQCQLYLHMKIKIIYVNIYIYIHVFDLHGPRHTQKTRPKLIAIEPKLIAIPSWTTLKLFSSDHPPAWSLSTAHLGGTPTAQMNNLAFSATMMSMSSGKWPEVAVQRYLKKNQYSILQLSSFQRNPSGHECSHGWSSVHFHRSGEWPNRLRMATTCQPSCSSATQSLNESWRKFGQAKRTKTSATQYCLRRLRMTMSDLLKTVTKMETPLHFLDLSISFYIFLECY